MLRFSTARPLILRDNKCIYYFIRGLSQLDKKQAIEAVVKRSEHLKEKVTVMSTSALTKYNEFVGFDEIERAYNKVTVLQEELAKIQAERTKVQIQINHTAKSLTSIQEQMQDCKRGEAKYIELMKKEFEIIQERNRLEDRFEILDNQEREFFAHLQAKINMLHEKSRTHTRKWGVISTIIGALLGIVGTSISAYYRNNDIKRVQEDFHREFHLQIERITKDTKHILEGYDSLMKYLNENELIVKQKANEVQEQKKQESWVGYFGRKTVAVWRWCTFQKG